MLKNLIEQYECFGNLEFPMVSEADWSDKLEDLYAALDLMDGYVEGIVSTYIKTGQYKYDITIYDQNFNNILQKVEQSDSLIRILKYKEALDQLVELFIKLLSKTKQEELGR